MVFGMATEKITITLTSEQLEKVRALVGSGGAKSVSAFVQHAVKNALQNDADFDKWLKEALDETGGPLTKKERDWVDSLLTGARTKRTSRKQKAA